tara:strand:+ start:201 stop:1034 length:834 start_codon:yes stop_codon:yes gene_type:complete
MYQSFKLKTPLRYPGGKSRAVKKIYPYLPDLFLYETYKECFLGGGSMAIWVTQQFPGVDVEVCDLYEPLINFWKELQKNGDRMVRTLTEAKQDHNDPDTARVLFDECKLIINQQSRSNHDRACAFYVVNKCSFSGLTEASSFSKQASNQNFSQSGIDRLSQFSELIQDWKIRHDSYESLLSVMDNAFVYLDPPYDIKDNLYGRKGSMHKSFDHDDFAAKCNAARHDCLISYNSNQLVEDRFGDKWKAGEFDLTYTMRSVGDYMKNQTQRKELLLMNY